MEAPSGHCHGGKKSTSKQHSHYVISVAIGTVDKNSSSHNFEKLKVKYLLPLYAFFFSDTRKNHLKRACSEQLENPSAVLPE